MYVVYVTRLDLWPCLYMTFNFWQGQAGYCFSHLLVIQILNTLAIWCLNQFQHTHYYITVWPLLHFNPRSSSCLRNFILDWIVSTLGGPCGSLKLGLKLNSLYLTPAIRLNSKILSPVSLGVLLIYKKSVWPCIHQSHIRYLSQELIQVPFSMLVGVTINYLNYVQIKFDV